MASGLPGVVLLALLCATLVAFVSADSKHCLAYTDSDGQYHPYERCYEGFCCGTCDSKRCCRNSVFRLTEDSQEECVYHPLLETSSVLGSVIGVVVLVVVVLISCCVCPCCCLYKICRKPRPVIATTTHTTVVTGTPQHYPQQPVMTAQPYQGGSYPAYQPVPAQPGYGGQPIPPQGYPPQPMPAMPHPVQPFTPGPPPTYQEATGPAYPPNPMPYSQAAFTPGQPSYPMQPPMQQPAVQPPVQPQANAPAAQVDYLAQPAYNPDFVSPPPKMG
ncbi:protein shisa-5-like [Corythoichthys intestinalis]|uniref:protein shisa-5-like n=1 Tax=Corythoichthys intestinalis TaxID=161448 RepID=UPI0025A55C9A|nr:protein shisa-5-like [Corythoichthys intestinalis]